MNLALDLDGTLISCEPRQTAVLRAALVGNGANVNLNRIWEFKREGASTAVALKKSGLSLELAHRVANDWRRMIEEPFWLGMDTVLPGVLEMLNEVRKEGIHICLLTARSRREWVIQQLTRLGLLPWLDHIVVVSPQGAVKAKTLVLCELSAVAFFGDTESDWRASNAAGVPFYAVASGQRSTTFLTSFDAGQVHLDLAAAWESFLTTSRHNHAA